MFAIKSDIVWFFIFIHVCKCERRIQDGKKSEAEKPYVVYFVKAPESRIAYDYWLCGGALVTSVFVVTSAACIKDVDYLYVIAGYKKYITDDQIEHDECTKNTKKKVIYTCYPQGYELRYENLDAWSLIDIGVARVESPYVFDDPSFLTLCSYKPSIIPISYDAKYQEAGIDAVVFGWGHKFDWRKQDDTANYNQEYLNYAPVLLISKRECKMHYEEHGKMQEVIENYMLCTLEGGHIDEFGERLPTDDGDEPKSFLNGCNNNNNDNDNRKSLAFNPDESIEDCEEDYEQDGTRREIKISSHSSNDSMIEIRNKNNGNKTRAVPNRTTVSNRTGLTNRTASINRTATINRTASFEKPFISNKTVIFNGTVRNTRRYGICQNDHGGPLVTWVGSHETLIGVASVFKVTDDYKCAGPYLYTSTQCNSAFLDCILTKVTFNFGRSSDSGIGFNSARRSFCRTSTDQEGHPTVERHITWKFHPAGAADHERDEPGINEEKVNEGERSVNRANNMKPPNKTYPLYEKISVNVNNAPNESYTANNKLVPNASNINNNGAPNGKYVANNQFAPGVPMVTNNKYRPYNIPASNSRPTSYNGPSPNNKPAQNNWPAPNYKSDQMNYHAPNNNPALNHGPAQQYGPAQNNRPAQNYGLAHNNGQAQNNRPAQNYGLVHNNGQAQNNRPAQNNGFAQNNEPAQNTVLAQNNGPAKNNRPEPDNNYAN